MYVDYHVHSEFSDDSIYPMEQIVKDAIAGGVEELCFTDHVDYGIKEDWDCGHEIRYRGEEPFANVDYPSYVSKISELQDKYNGQIRIKLGLEFGMQMHTISKYEKLFKRYPFDFIILSVHQVEDLEFWNQDFQRGRTQKEIRERYYEEMLQLVNGYQNYSVLGHMDMIDRYDEYGSYPFEKLKPVIEEILKTVIKNGKGMEFNTSYHRYGLKDTTPSVEILKLYKQLGGEILSLGSDSHSAEHLGAYMDEARDILKKVGFEYFCTYDKMIPQFHKL